MQNIQEIFDRIEKTKQEIREITNLYKNELAGSTEYEEVKQKVAGYKLRKKQIESGVEGRLSAELSKRDALKAELASDKQMLADIALANYLKGEKVEVRDKNDVLYAPQFSVVFKKNI